MLKSKVAVMSAHCVRLLLAMQRPSHVLKAFVLLLVIATSAGCAGQQLPLSVSEGVCNIVPRAEYEILGKTRHDQRWINDTIEGEVGGCGFQRPDPRPASWDVATNSSAPVVQPVTTKQPGFMKRQVAKAKTLFRGTRKPKAGSVAPLEPAPVQEAAGKMPYDGMPWGVRVDNPPPFPATVTPPQPAPVPPKPRSPVDELLDAKPPPNTRK